MRIVYFPFINFYGIILCEKEYNRNEESIYLTYVIIACLLYTSDAADE